MPQALLRFLVLAALAAAMLAGACGKKGPLYLPDEAPRRATPPAGAPAPQP
jgi:predicted small lipoprotein YifL